MVLPLPLPSKPVPAGYEHISHGAARLLDFLQIDYKSCKFDQDLSAWDKKQGVLKEIFYFKHGDFPYVGFFLDDSVCFLALGSPNSTFLTIPAPLFRSCLQLHPKSASAGMEIDYIKPAQGLSISFQWNPATKRLATMHAGHEMGFFSFEPYKPEEDNIYHNAILYEGKRRNWEVAYVREKALQEQAALLKLTDPLRPSLRPVTKL